MDSLEKASEFKEQAIKKGTNLPLLYRERRATQALTTTNLLLGIIIGQVLYLHLSKSL
jgi:hypothetical protein